MGAEVIIFPVLFGSIAWLVYVVVDGFRRRQRLRVFTEFHSKLLDRIGSAREFGEFFGSDAGRRFLESLASEEGRPQARILAALQWGMTLISLGVAIFVLLGVRSFGSDTVDVLAFVATVATGIGIGSVISSFVSYLLSKRMGLVDRVGGQE